MKILLDVHVAKAAIGALRKATAGIDAEHISQWRGGAFLRADDEEILAACHTENRVLVTYDMATIPDLLRRWMAEGRPHSGVVFADENTVRPNVPGEVARAVASLEKREATLPTLFWFNSQGLAAGPKQPISPLSSSSSGYLGGARLLPSPNHSP